MKSMILAQSVLLIVLLSGCATLSEKFALSYDLPKGESVWVERNPPTGPLNADEALAVQSAAGLITLQRVKRSAYYESSDENFAVIRHEKRLSGEEVYFVAVKYRIMGGLVYGETIPSVVAKLDPKKEAIAREVAIQEENGTAPEIPDIYEGRMYIVKNFFYNSCTVDVVEKDMDREYATYRVNKCQDVLAIAPEVGNVLVSKNVF